MSEIIKTDAIGIPGLGEAEIESDREDVEFIQCAKQSGTAFLPLREVLSKIEDGL